MTISIEHDGVVHELRRNDPMLERVDLSYAINVHVAQGVTTNNGVAMTSAAERQLSSAKSFLVAMTLIADKAMSVVDSGRDFQRTVEHNPGEKTSAVDAVLRDNPTMVLALEKSKDLLSGCKKRRISGWSRKGFCRSPQRPNGQTRKGHRQFSFCIGCGSYSKAGVGACAT